MIAGSYTPFTVAGLSGVWAVAMTAAIAMAMAMAIRFSSAFSRS